MSCFQLNLCNISKDISCCDWPYPTKQLPLPLSNQSEGALLSLTLSNQSEEACVTDPINQYEEVSCFPEYPTYQKRYPASTDPIQPIRKNSLLPLNLTNLSEERSCFHWPYPTYQKRYPALTNPIQPTNQKRYPVSTDPIQPIRRDTELNQPFRRGPTVTDPKQPIRRDIQLPLTLLNIQILLWKTLSHIRWKDILTNQKGTYCHWPYPTNRRHIQLDCS